MTPKYVNGEIKFDEGMSFAHSLLFYVKIIIIRNEGGNVWACFFSLKYKIFIGWGEVVLANDKLFWLKSIGRTKLVEQNLVERWINQDGEIG